MTDLHYDPTEVHYDGPFPSSATVSGGRAGEAVRMAHAVKDGHAIHGRDPVGLLLGTPPRSDVSAQTGRRPRIATLDAAVAEDPWLTSGPDPFVVDAVSRGWPCSPVFPSIVDDPHRATAELGHGTFGAGLLRQLAPMAAVLSFAVMNDQGDAPHEAVVSALEFVCVACESGDPDRFVDLVLAPWGYYEEQPEQSTRTNDLRRLLGRLGDLGVRVVAAVGNSQTMAPSWPAAFGACKDSLPATRLLGVGAYGLDGAIAPYSDRGDWVTAWATGSSLVSTVGTNVSASRFATWSGASFAAASLTGHLAAALADPATGGNLRDVSLQACQDRAQRALDNVGDGLP